MWLTKLIYLIIEIESFEQQHVSLKGLFQSDRLKQHMVTIGIDQWLSNCAMYEKIDYWKTSINFTHSLENVIINSIIKLLMKRYWYPLLIYS